MKPYYSDATTTLWHGDMRDLIPGQGLTADCIVTDPPYGETSLTWDRWPDGWVKTAATASRSMWCFGSMRMYLERGHEFAAWQLSQDIVWEKHNGSGFAKDRFKRVHEHALHWYTGPWSTIHHQTPRVPRTGPAKAVKNRTSTPHTGAISGGVYVDDGLRLARSVLPIRSMHGRAIHPTEKPVDLLDMLIRYACPPGGTILDPFAGSGSTAAAANLTGRHTILIEADEEHCAQIADRLTDGGGP